MPDWAGIVCLVVLLAANAFFVGAEFAVISARRSQIEPAAERGKRSAVTALWAMEHATLMLATTQLGITVCSLLILNVSEPAIHHLLEGPLALTGLSEDGIGVAAFVITLVLVSFLHVVLGEMVPKNLSFSFPDRAVVLLAPPLVAVGRVVRPITRALNATSNGVVRLFGVTPRDEAVSAFTLEEVETIVEQSTREGVLQDSTGTLSNAFEFSMKRASEVSVPLDKLVRLPATATPADVERAVAKNGFSRYVIEDDQGQPSGYVHLKDVLELEGEAFDRPIPAAAIRPLVVVADDAEIEDVLAVLRRRATHLARVVDAAGATVGVVFLEDILEELVGEVHDATVRSSRRS
ncbi:hemolysin family protein [Gryllotalpicola ginsengisoli]|uniref:hemolysin family protein n=1 Tax=Gryllotalpicola ginsengisoli TaxID=444608 RepID=UPI0003FC24B7|nr:hemolysin family protein [Gryllotalpicola ginsengisoli]